MSHVIIISFPTIGLSEFSYIISICYSICNALDISVVGIKTFEGHEGHFDVDVFDSTGDYVTLME